MAEVTVKLSVYVTLDVPEELAGKVTREDLVSMARDACPDSMTTPGAPTGIQVCVEEVAQEDGGMPVFAGVFVEHDICEDAEIEFDDEGFTRAEGEEARVE